MTLDHAMQLTDCPPEAWTSSRMRPTQLARARVYAAMRCNWGGHPVIGMSTPDISGECWGWREPTATGKVRPRKGHSTVLTTLKRECKSTEAGACRAWLDRWAAERQEMAA